MQKHLGLRCAALIVVLGVGGCSFFMRPVPKDWDRTGKPDCDSHIVIPIVDALVAVTATFWAVSACDRGLGDCAVGVIPAGVFGTASYIGYRKLRKCQRAVESAENPGQIAGVRIPPGDGIPGWN